MQQIRKEVYDALFVSKMTEHRQSKPDSLGDTKPGEDVEYRCYYYTGFEKIVNADGEECISNMQIYVKGEDAVSIRNDSTISCDAAVKQKILSIRVYRGRAGAPVIGVIYLP